MKTVFNIDYNFNHSELYLQIVRIRNNNECYYYFQKHKSIKNR